MRVLAPKSSELHLEKKDWRILNELIFNVRKPITQIAKNCFLSRQSTEYRLHLMEEKQLITGSRAIINVNKLGYHSYHIFIEAHTLEEEKKIITKAIKAEFVNALIIYSGKYNLEISIMARDETEFLNLYEKLINDIKIRDEHILILQKTVISEVLPQKYFPRLDSLKIKDEKKILSKVNDQKLELDALDLHLLYSLSQNATSSNSSLAHQFKVSKDTIAYRIKKLEEHQYLLQYRPIINFATLGLSINSILIKLNYSSKKIMEFETYLLTQGDVLWAVKTLGYYNYLIYIITKDLDEFHEVINGIKKKFDDIIKTYEVLFAFEEKKYDFMAKSILQENNKKNKK